MKHLKTVNETYLKHFFEAVGISIAFVISGMVCFIHALFPFLFQNTASSIVKKVLQRVETRKSKNV